MKLLKNKGTLSREEFERELKKLRDVNVEHYYPTLKKRDDVGTFRMYFRLRYFSPDERRSERRFGKNQISFIYLLGEEQTLGEAIIKILPSNLMPGATNYFLRLFRKLKLPEKAYEVVQQYLKKGN